MERTSFNRVSNLDIQGIKSDQVDQSPLSEEKLLQQFPSLSNMNSDTQTHIFNLLNLINHLWGNQSSAFVDSARQPTNKQLILALLNLGGSLNLVDAQKLLKFCRDDNLVENGINFKRIHGYFENNPYVHNSITSDEFDAYINNQPGGDQVATLVENIVYNTPSARQAGVDTLLKLLISSSKNIDYLKYLLEVVTEFAFVENDPIDKESMRKLAQQLDQHIYKQNDVIVALVNKIKSNVARAEIGNSSYGINPPQHASFRQTGVNSNNPTQANPQSLTNNNGIFPLVNKINEFIDDKNQSSEMMQVYLQQFNSSQIDDYITNYIKENKSELEQQITLNQLTSQWLNPDYTRTQIQKITGLYQLIHIPFMCSLILAEIPKLISLNQSRVTSYNAYEIIIKGWISKQIINKAIPVFIEAVFEFAQKLAFTLQVDNIEEIDLSQISSYINPERGIHKKTKLQNRWDWFKEATTICLVLPLELAKPNIYRFMHKSIQEFLVARHLCTQLMQATEFEDLDWNKITLSNDDPTSNSIISFLVDILNVDSSFRDKLAKLSEYAKGNNTQTKALTNINSLYHYEYLQLGLFVEKNDVNQVSSIITQIFNDKNLNIDEKMKFLSAVDKNGVPGFCTALYNGNAPAIKEFATLILNADSNILSPANKLELLLVKDNDGNPGFYWALQEGHAEAIKEFVTLILNADSKILTPANKLELLLAKNSKGIPGFYLTLQEGHAEAIKEFATLTLNADSKILTPANKLELLLAKNSKGVPGFYWTLQEGHAPTIKKFITLILNADSSILSLANKLELLLAKASDGFPGFYMALYNGHAGAVKEFITLILNVGSNTLSPANKLELLLAKDKNGFPGFYLVLQEGHAPTIKEFVTLILNADSSILSPANKLELLLAKDKNGFPGFYVALENGHAEAIKEFITLILNADSSILSPANKLELLLAKDKDGFIGFYVALENGHVEAIKEFIALILNADSSILSRANKLELLLAKDKYGFTGFYLVLQEGHAPTIKEFVTLILNADSSILSPANKLELLLAKDKNGFPGFYVALENGHAEAIKEFIGILSKSHGSNILTSR